MNIGVGMFKGVPKTKTEIKASVDPHLFQVRPADVLLATEKRAGIVAHLAETVQKTLSRSVYTEQYLRAMNNFAEFVQELPQTKTSYYSHQGGLLDHGLDRARIAFTLCHAFLMPTPTDKPFSPIEELWLYAVFTASLLLDVGRMAIKQEVQIFKQDLNPLGIWQPFQGSMVGKAHFYKYDFHKENQPRLEASATSILAVQLMTKGFVDNVEGMPTGFNWIASNREVLDIWLAILNQDTSGGGKILTFILLAEAQSIAANLAEEKKGVAGRRGLFAHPGLLPSTEDVAVAMAFLDWLKAAIESGRLKFNGSEGDAVHLQKMKEGVFVGEELFKQFAKEKPGAGNSNQIMKQFANSDFHVGPISAELGGVTSQIMVGKVLELKGFILPPTMLFLLGRTLGGAPNSFNAVNITRGAQGGPKAEAKTQGPPIDTGAKPIGK